MLADVLTPRSLKPGHPLREGYEYERKGTANLFGVLEPLSDKRWLKATEQRTKTEFAACMQHVCDVLYPHAVTIREVLNNLNTHTIAALYETFPSAEARRLATRLEFHFTSKHGSWLNAARIEFAVLSRQCLDRRINSLERLCSEVEAWSRKRNHKRVGVKWRFITDDARRKLPCVYPTIPSNFS